MSKKDLLEQYNEDFVEQFIKEDNLLYRFAYTGMQIKIVDRILVVQRVILKHISKSLS